MRDSNFSNVEPVKNSCIFSVKEVDPDLLLEELIKFEEVKDSFKLKSSIKDKKEKSSMKSKRDKNSELNKSIEQIQESDLEYVKTESNESPKKISGNSNNTVTNISNSKSLSQDHDIS